MLVNIDRHALGPVNLVVRLADQLPFDPVFGWSSDMQLLP